MIQAKLTLKELNIDMCIESFYDKYVDQEQFNTIEIWKQYVYAQSNIEEYLYSLLDKHEYCIQNELDEYVHSIGIDGIRILSFRIKNGFTVLTSVDYLQFLDCEFLKSHINPILLKPLKKISNPEKKSIVIGNKFQDKFYKQIYKVLNVYGVYGTIDHYELIVLDE